MQRFHSWRTRSENSWYHLHLDAGQLAAHEDDRLRLRFDRAYLQAHCPDGMNLWAAPVTARGADVYLSPQSQIAAGELIRRYRATACASPTQALVLIGGHRYLPADAGSSQWREHRAQPRIRSFVPAGYHYCSVRALDQAHPSEYWAYDCHHQMAPFVRRFVQAWWPVLRACTGRASDRMTLAIAARAPSNRPQ